MQSFKTLGITFLLFSGLSSGLVQAQLNESMDRMCEKIKTCGIAQLAKEDLSKEVQEMMSGMFDGMCQSMLAPHMQSVGQAGLENKAEACIDSMLDSSCDELMSENEPFSSAACKNFEKSAEAAGLAQ